MEQQVHAHKVLNQLKVQPMTEQQLREFVATQFGSEVLFHTCKLSGMDLDNLLVFFQQNSKVVIQDGIWHLNESEICQH